MPYPEPSPIADYLARREALTGEARRQFIQLLADNYDYRSRAPRKNFWLPGAVAAGLAGLGIDAWLSQGALPGWLWVGWPALSATGVVLSLSTRSDQKESEPQDHELHWRVYCLLVRPIILAERPGLLDRNLPVYNAPLSILTETPLKSVRAFASGRGTQFWRAALVGLWLGMGGLLVVRLSHAITGPGALLLPAGGMIAGPLVWGICQLLVLRIVTRDPRLSP